jgi:hypothetical protein
MLHATRVGRYGRSLAVRSEKDGRPLLDRTMDLDQPFLERKLPQHKYKYILLCVKNVGRSRDGMTWQRVSLPLRRPLRSRCGTAPAPPAQRAHRCLHARAPPRRPTPTTISCTHWHSDTPDWFVCGRARELRRELESKGIAAENSAQLLSRNRIGTRLSLELRCGCAAHSHEDRNVIRVVNTARDASERYIVHCPLMLPPQRRYLRARSRVVAAEVPAIANSTERINSAVDSQPAAARALRATGCCASITVRSQSILRQQWNGAATNAANRTYMNGRCAHMPGPEYSCGRSASVITL